MESTTMEERRGRPRSTCNVRFSYFYRGQRREAMMANVSESGAYLTTSIFPPPGSIILLESFHDAARGLIVRFVVQVARALDALSAGGVTGEPGIGIQWRRAYCNRGARSLQRFIHEHLGFEVDVEAFMAENQEQAEREVFYDFPEQRFRLRTPRAADGRASYFHQPTPRSYMLIRDLPPANLREAAEKQRADAQKNRPESRRPSRPEPLGHTPRRPRPPGRSSSPSAPERIAVEREPERRRTFRDDGPLWPPPRDTKHTAQPAASTQAPAAGRAGGGIRGEASPAGAGRPRPAPESVLPPQRTADKPRSATGDPSFERILDPRRDQRASSRAPVREPAGGSRHSGGAAEDGPWGSVTRPIVQQQPRRDRDTSPWAAGSPPSSPFGTAAQPPRPTGQQAPRPTGEQPPASAPPRADQPPPRVAAERPAGDNAAMGEARVGVTYSIGNRHFTGFTSHIGLEALRVTTRETAPELGARVMVRLPLARQVGYHIVRLTCRVADVTAAPAFPGAPINFELAIQSIDEADSPGGFRQYVDELLGG